MKFIIKMHREAITAAFQYAFDEDENSYFEILFELYFTLLQRIL
jgi:hypothetical protein